MNESRHAIFLREMGLGPLWIARSTSQGRDHSENPVQHSVEIVADVAQERATSALPDEWSAASSRVSAWDETVVPDVSPGTVVPVVEADAMQDDIAQMDWQQLKSTVSGCTKCGLCKTRTNTVLGVGDQKARWLFVGEGPGRNEDAQGLPFVGPAGKLLDNMMVSMGMKRGENTYIANIVKCRPTDAAKKDRAPTPEEASACLPYLKRQIELIDPTVIVALGKTAALALLKLDPDTPVGKLRGTVHRYENRPLVVTYHPAYLLRSLKEKSKTWADLCLAMQAFRGNAAE